MSVNCRCNWKIAVARRPAVRVSRSRIAATARMRHGSNIASRLNGIVAPFSSRPKNSGVNASGSISRCSSVSKGCGESVRPNHNPGRVRSRKAGRGERRPRGTGAAAERANHLAASRLPPDPGRIGGNGPPSKRIE